MPSKALNEAQFLNLLEKVLAETTKDSHLATAIYQGVSKEVNLIKSLQSFEKFCEKGSIPDKEPETLANLQSELASKFGEGSVEITPDEKGEAVAVEISLPDRVVNTQVKIMSEEQAAAEAAVAPFVPFPISLPDDPGLVWVLGRRENFGPDEAMRALERIQEEFWQTKKGQQLQQKGVDKCFAEFIVEVPASALADSGLKRHYKTPEALYTLRLGNRPEGEDLEGALRGERDEEDSEERPQPRRQPVPREERPQPKAARDDDDADEADLPPPWDTEEAEPVESER